jgi:protease II
MDDDPTHYIDIAVSKDKKYLIINSGTKEDSEIWVIKNVDSNEPEKIAPKLLIPRKKDVRVHIEHLRDFFLIISNNEATSKNFKL